MEKRGNQKNSLLAGGSVDAFPQLPKPVEHETLSPMADFFQDGEMATLHRLGTPDLPRLETSLLEFSRQTPIALVLPCHVKELGSHALRQIVKELQEVRYISQIVVGIDGASTPDWERARRIFAPLPQNPILLWNDGPRLKRLMQTLKKNDLDPGPTGKGRNLWLCFGLVLARGQARMVVAHDCDILTYSREMLARLCYPVAHANLGFDFCKGYSARFTKKLNGRVMRLLFTPLIRSLQGIIGHHPFLEFLDTFRYPLSGEVSLSQEVIRRARMPSDWGVEVGMLAEVYRVSPTKSICQVDMADCYEHKHQDLSSRDAKKGLNKMATDIVKCIFRTLAGHGVKLDRGTFDALLSSYTLTAEDTMRFYAADAEINGLEYDRHEEKISIDMFVRSIRSAAEAFLNDPLGHPLIPSWDRVDAALPDFLRDLDAAVQIDNRQGKRGDEG